MSLTQRKIKIKPRIEYHLCVTVLQKQKKRTHSQNSIRIYYYKQYIYDFNEIKNNEKGSHKIHPTVWPGPHACAQPLTITWKILKQAAPYNHASNRCNLYLWKKYFVIVQPDLASLNKRNELITSCRHANKFLLKISMLAQSRNNVCIYFQPQPLLFYATSLYMIAITFQTVACVFQISLTS